MERVDGTWEEAMRNGKVQCEMGRCNVKQEGVMSNGKVQCEMGGGNVDWRGAV